MMELSTKIKIQSLADMHELMKTLTDPDSPTTVYLPWTSFRTVADRVNPQWKASDTEGEYVWFEGAKIRPPSVDKTRTYIVDLSGAQEE